MRLRKKPFLPLEQLFIGEKNDGQRSLILNHEELKYLGGQLMLKQAFLAFGTEPHRAMAR